MDREKVIKGLKCLITDDVPCDGCPYNGSGYCIKNIASDALALLKEQEAVEPKSKVRHGANAQIQHFCGNCNSMLHGKQKYCSECGQAVKWE